MAGPVRQVMFDLGVVLLHLDYTQALARCRALCDPARAEAGGRFLGLLGRNPLVAEYERGDLSAEEFYRRFVEHTGFQGSLELFVDIWRQVFAENTPMIDLAHELARRYPVYLMTNAGDMHVPWVFDAVPRLRFFKDCACSCYLRALKPEPAFYEKALAQFGLGAEGSLFIDDRPENIETAACLGFRTVLYKDAEQAIREIRIQAESA